MTAAVVIDLFREAIYLGVIVVAVIVFPSLVVGLIVSVFQAATQINEQTLSFLPRLLITFMVLAIAGPWLGTKITVFAEKLILDIPLLIG